MAITRHGRTSAVYATSPSSPAVAIRQHALIDWRPSAAHDRASSRELTKPVVFKRNKKLRPASCCIILSQYTLQTWGRRKGSCPLELQLRT
eukprot:364701-Chlamydomonas_euryale.AAC.1